MGPGDVLYQDDFRGRLVGGVKPVHYSGALDGFVSSRYNSFIAGYFPGGAKPVS